MRIIRSSPPLKAITKLHLLARRPGICAGLAVCAALAWSQDAIAQPCCWPNGTPANCDLLTNACLTYGCVNCYCAPISSLDCTDDNFCNFDLCNTLTGCYHPDRWGESCRRQSNACYSYECDPHTGSCVTTWTNTCNDGNYCNGEERCDPVSGCYLYAPPPICEDGNPCTDNYCDPKQGCVTLPHCRAADCLISRCGIGGACQPPYPPFRKQIRINFDPPAISFDSCDGGSYPFIPVSTPPSGLSPDARQRIVDRTLSIYEAAFPGWFSVSEGSGGDGDINVIVTSAASPIVCGDPFFGSADPSPVIIYLGGFNPVEFGTQSDDRYIRAVSRTLAHEIGHVLLGGGHNCDQPPTLMTAGGKVSAQQRQTGADEFNPSDIERLKWTFCNSSNRLKSLLSPIGIGLRDAQAAPPAQTPSDDKQADVTWQYEGGGIVGYMSESDDFVPLGREGSGLLSVPTFAVADFAVFLPEAFRTPRYQMLDGYAKITLQIPDPNNPLIHRKALIEFDFDGDGQPEATLTLQPEYSADFGGYFDPCGQNPSGDVDADGDVDLKDFALMQRCYAGDVAMPPLRCNVCYDRNEDGNVGPNDFIRWSNCFAGPDVAADPACDD